MPTTREEFRAVAKKELEECIFRFVAQCMNESGLLSGEAVKELIEETEIKLEAIKTAYIIFSVTPTEVLQKAVNLEGHDTKDLLARFERTKQMLELK